MTNTSNAKAIDPNVPTITITDEGGVFVLMMAHLGSDRLVATVPTGSRAAYPEAIARGRVDANRKVVVLVDDCRMVYAGLAVVDQRPDGTLSTS